MSCNNDQLIFIARHFVLGVISVLKGETSNLIRRLSLDHPERVTWWRETAQIAAIVAVLIANPFRYNSRHLFYKLADKFGTQERCNACVRKLAAAAGVSRGALGVFAGAKALVRGPIHIFSSNQSPAITTDLPLDCMSTLTPEGSLLPSNFNRIRVVQEVRWILVVEKHSAFSRIVRGDLVFKRFPTGIALTARGFPDVAARQLLSVLADQLSPVPIIMMCDADPHGFNIAATWAGLIEGDVPLAEAFPCGVPHATLLCCTPQVAHEKYGVAKEEISCFTSRDVSFLKSLRTRLRESSRAISFRNALEEFENNGAKFELDAIPDLLEFLSQVLNTL